MACREWLGSRDIDPGTGQAPTFQCIDEGVREALDIFIDTSIPGGRLARTLEQLSRWRGHPDAIRCDNGPEILSQVFVDWCQDNDVEIRVVRVGG